MKMSTYLTIALAAMASLALLLTGPSMAKSKDKNDLSVYEWGPWSVMGTPAAGPGVIGPLTGPSVTGMSFRAGDDDPHTAKLIPPEEQPVLLEGPCTAGTPCGWASYSYGYDLIYEYDLILDVENEVPDYERESGPIIARFKIPILVLDPANPAEAVDGEGVISKASFITTPILYHPDYPQVESIQMTEGIYYTSYASTWAPQWLYELTGEADRPDDLVEIGALGHEDKAGGGSAWSGICGDMVINPWETDIVIGYWSNGNVESTDYVIKTVNNGLDNLNMSGGCFIHGTTSAQETLDSLNAGNVVLSYEGITIGHLTPMTATLNFGDSSWSASFNEGRDGMVGTWTDAKGVLQINGAMGFDVSGHLAGPNLIADSITAKDGAVAPGSIVEGAVFGNSAQIIGGGYEITKTTKAYTNGRQADVFVGVEQSLLTD